jgi:hypothetical protein
MPVRATCDPRRVREPRVSAMPPAAAVHHAARRRCAGETRAGNGGAPVRKRDCFGWLHILRQKKKKKKKKKKRKKKAAAPSRLRYQCARPRCFPATDHPLIIFIYFSLVLHSSQFITEDPDSAPEEGEIVEDDDAEADPPSEPAEEPAKKRPRLDDAEDMDPERLAFLDFIGRRPPHIPPVQPLFPPKIGRL